MANKPDVELLFGVLGGGSVSGQSGSTIRGQLEEIVRGLNSSANVKQRGILLGLDRQGTKSAFAGELKEIIGGLSGQKQFKLKISKIDATAAINDVKRQLQDMLGALSVKNGIKVAQQPGHSGASASMVTEQIGAAQAQIADWKAQMKALDALSKSVTATYRSGIAGSGTIQDGTVRSEIISSYGAWQNKIEEVRAARTALSNEEQAALAAEGTAISDKVMKIQAEQTQRKAAAAAAEKAAEREKIAAEKAAAAETEKSASLKQVMAFYKQIDSYLKGNPRVLGTEEYKQLVSMKASLSGAAAEASGLNGELSTMPMARFKELQAQFSSLTTVLHATGRAGRSLGDWMKSAYEKFGGWMFITKSLMMALRIAKQMVSAVAEIDKAMTELRKVTDEADLTYARFLDHAATRAKALGATVADTVSATADFARLGYSLEDSSTLADTALVYKNVGDGIENINEASESVISTMRAFHIEAKQSMEIVDKFNEVGKNCCPTAQ